MKAKAQIRISNNEFFNQRDHVYKKAMDAAEKSCKNTPDKDACMAAFRHRAYKARVSSLKGKLKKCTSTNNPGKCRKYIRKTITTLKKRVG